jgi:peptide/nickel transport system ATP-binding protein
VSAREPVLEVRELRVSYARGGVRRAALDGVSLELRAGHVLALLGASGSGKSTLALALLGLLPHNARVEGGRVALRGRELARPDDWRAVRGRGVAWLPQDSNTALDPLMRIGAQVCEALTVCDGLAQDEARVRALAALARAGLPEGRDVLERYPHELSGGMRQRALFAQALAREPEVLIADEPTSALDATLALQWTERVREQCARGMAVLWITHDVALAYHASDELAVLQHGRIVERGATRDVCERPAHEATSAFVRAARDSEPGAGGGRA